jgi:outer membrane protein TolC
MRPRLRAPETGRFRPAALTGMLRRALLASIAFCSLGAAPETLTLEQAIVEARARNASLPVAREDASVARSAADEARAKRYPHFDLAGELQLARPGAYGESHGLAKLLGAFTLFDAGQRGAELRAALSELARATAGVQKSEADLDLEVRTRFDELAELDEELVARSEGVARLTRYQVVLEERRAGGEGGNADLLKTRARALSDQATIEALRRSRSTAARELNDLMGREPAQSILLVAAPMPSPPAEVLATAWERAPDLTEAAAVVGTAQERQSAAASERWPRLELRAEVGGVLPLLGSTLDAVNLPTAPGSGFGGAVGLTFSMPLFDFGVIGARIAQADAVARKAQAELELARRRTRLQWTAAQEDLSSLFRELSLRERLEPVAKDAYLAAEALYRGGAGTGLEVLDAYTAWLDSEVKLVQARQSLRDAQARVLRWEGK